MLSKLSAQRSLNFGKPNENRTYSKRHRYRIQQRVETQDIASTSATKSPKYNIFSRNLNKSKCSPQDGPLRPVNNTSTPTKQTSVEHHQSNTSGFSLPSYSSSSDENSESPSNHSSFSAQANTSEKSAEISAVFNNSDNDVCFGDLKDLLSLFSDISTLGSLNFSSSSDGTQIPSRAPKNVASSVETEKESISKFKDRLQVVCVKNNLKHVAINDLLALLRTLPSVGHLLPKDARTLLKTIRQVSTVKINDDDQELYVHIGIEVLLRNYFLNVKVVTEFNILIGIDGLPLAKSSTAHFWPILIAIIPDDPNERSFIAPIGVWYSPTKTCPADPNAFLEPFLNDIKSVLTNGFKIDGEVLKVNLKGITLDIVAKSELLGVKGHGGYEACPRCKVVGIHDGGIHFPGVDFEPRGHEDFTEMYMQEVENGSLDDSHHLRYTILEQIPGIDMVKDIVYDYMHLLCIGTAKTIVKMWFQMKPPNKLSAAHVKRINNRQAKIGRLLPREFARKSKNIQHSHRWKATEGRQFLAYTGGVLMLDILPDAVYKNFLLLHVSTYIMLHPVLNKKYTERARKYLKDFILSYEELFGRNHVTLNIHSLQHLVDDVIRFGCLNRISAFQFENFLGMMLNLLRKGDKPLAQLIKRLAEKSAALIAEKSLEENTESTPSGEIAYSQQHSSGPLLQFSNPQYRCAVFRNRFTLCASQVMGDSCIVTADKKFYLIQNFVSDEKGDKFILVKKFLSKENFFTEPMKSSKLGIYRVHSLSEEITALPVTAIKNKVVLIKAKEKGNFIAYPLLHSSL